VLEKFRNVENMKANEIIDNIRRSYAIGITNWWALRAKHKSIHILEGDGQQHYF